MLVTTSLFPRGFGPMLNATWGCTVSQLISCLSFFLEVFVFFWGEGGRRLYQHNLQAGAFGVNWEGLQSWRQYGIGHLCWLLRVWFPEFHRCCGKKSQHFPILSDAISKGKKNPKNNQPTQSKKKKQTSSTRLQEKSLNMFLPKGTLPRVFPQEGVIWPSVLIVSISYCK